MNERPMLDLDGGAEDFDLSEDGEFVPGRVGVVEEFLLNLEDGDFFRARLPSPGVPTGENPERIVHVAERAACYHYDPECSAIKNVRHIRRTLERAVTHLNRWPCRKCCPLGGK